jgi:ATP-dependent helicase/nuclease subunit A
MDKEINNKDWTGSFITDFEKGIGINYVDSERRIKRTTLIRTAISDKIKTDSLGEEIRVLYVAMTRAKEKLILMGSVKNFEEWTKSAKAKTENCYLDMVQSAVLLHKDNFDVHVIKESDLETSDTVVTQSSLELAAKEEKLFMDAETSDRTLADEISKRFNFIYPYTSLSKLYTKTTVSELKMAAIKEEEDESFHPFEETEPEEFVPVFAGGNVSVKGTDRGTAYHNILELLEYDKLLDAIDKKKELDDELLTIINKGEMPEADVLKANKKKLLEFVNSETAKSMGRACKEGKLFKEQPFVIGVKASTLSDDFPESETVLVQGVIDVYYIEDGKITVLDYKTDKVGSADELIKRYRTQLDYYAEAIGKLTGLPVFKKVIYSFALSKTIEL